MPICSQNTVSAHHCWLRRSPPLLASHAMSVTRMYQLQIRQLRRLFEGEQSHLARGVELCCF